MVRLIPDSISKDASYGERVIFNALEGVTSRNNWIVFYSLHQYKVVQGVEAEGDFVVLIPGKGLIIIEAKGATQVDLHGSVWTIDGVPSGARNKSPLEQAENTRNNVIAQIRQNDINVESLPAARLVWFPRMDAWQFDDKKDKGMEFYPWEVAFRAELKDIVATLEHAIDSQIELGLSLGRPYKPELYDEAEMARIVDCLRIDVSAKYSIEGKDEVRTKELELSTKNLDRLWRAVRNNQNIYFEGVAGTGKSYLLGKSALRLAQDGRKVLITCYSNMMADEYEIRFGKHPNIDVIQINELFLQTARLKEHKSGDAWFDHELPIKAKNAVGINEFLAKYDAICIDEFQDIASKPNVVDAIFMFYKREGEYDFTTILAGDDYQQIMRTSESVDSYEVAKGYLADLVKVSLLTNCRQAPGLSHAIFKFLKWDDSDFSHDLASNVEWAFDIKRPVSGGETKELASVLRHLLESNKPERIRILSPFGEHRSLLAKLFNRESENSDEEWLKSQLRHKDTEGKIRWRSISKYKGLEEDVVVITDINLHAKNDLAEKGISLDELLYVGLTRARFQVVLLIGDQLYKSQTT